MVMLRPVSSAYVLGFSAMKSRALIGVYMLGLQRVPPARPNCARRFDSRAAFGVKDTVLGPLVMKPSCLMVGVWRYGISTNRCFLLGCPVLGCGFFHRSVLAHDALDGIFLWLLPSSMEHPRWMCGRVHAYRFQRLGPTR